jgi:hypothetical protein
LRRKALWRSFSSSTGCRCFTPRWTLLLLLLLLPPPPPPPPPPLLLLLLLLYRHRAQSQAYLVKRDELYHKVSAGSPPHACTCSIGV